MSSKKHKKLTLKFWLLLPVTLPIIFIVMNNGFYKRAIFAVYLILGFALMRLVILMPFKTVAGIIIYLYFFALMPFIYFGMLKDYMPAGAAKALAVLLALATLFAAMAATSGL